MLTFRRALVVAAVILTCFLLLRNTHPSQPQAPAVHNSPKPTGSYSDNKALQDAPPESQSTGGVQKPPQKVWDGDSATFEAQSVSAAGSGAKEGAEDVSLFGGSSVVAKLI